MVLNDGILRNPNTKIDAVNEINQVIGADLAIEKITTVLGGVITIVGKIYLK
ncbi:hypothetical protein [uncultured archaeal virus]|uniref:Uncharacterized protein n=1 Tax=uncultured archaeal virus TaxID=1960247 RepID=A0A8B0LS75_9VIRU|nr:hypothetical protein [uncultured archaeal virus]